MIHDSPVHDVLVSRLWSLLGEDFYDPWCAGSLPEVEGEIATPYAWPDLWTAVEHSMRINWLMKNAEALSVPIKLDWEDSLGYPALIIWDGNHRFFAHLFLERETISCEYAGDVDVLDWLQGRMQIVPDLIKEQIL